MGNLTNLLTISLEFHWISARFWFFRRLYARKLRGINENINKAVQVGRETSQRGGLLFLLSLLQRRGPSVANLEWLQNNATSGVGISVPRKLKRVRPSGWLCSVINNVEWKQGNQINIRWFPTWNRVFIILFICMYKYLNNISSLDLRTLFYETMEFFFKPSLCLLYDEFLLYDKISLRLNSWNNNYGSIKLREGQWIYSHPSFVSILKQHQLIIKNLNTYFISG